MATPVIMPKQGQSVETCIINEWFVKPGQSVKKGEKLFTYETDKATFEEEAPVDGILLGVFYQDGDEVPVLVNVAVIGNAGESCEEYKPKSTDAAQSSSSVKNEVETKIETVVKDNTVFSSVFSAPSGDVKISPRAKKLAQKLQIDFKVVRGTGPNGRIIEKDIDEYAQSGTRLTSLSQDIQANENKYASTTGTGLGGRVLSSELMAASAGLSDDSEVKKISNIRKIVAQKMQASLQNSAQLTHHMSANASKMMKYRNEFKKLQESGRTGNITLNDMVCYAVIKALKAQPEINSHFLGDSMRFFKKVHLGLAVQTDRGLMVPTLRNADDFSVDELSVRLKVLADSCKKGNIDPELLDSTSASFTVSNLGVYGVEMFTPVLNLPQSGILGICAVSIRPVENKDGKIEFTPHIGLSLTYNHQALDGAPASAFLKEVKDHIEKIELKF